MDAVKEDIGNKINDIFVSSYKFFVSIPKIFGITNFPRKTGEVGCLREIQLKLPLKFYY